MGVSIPFKGPDDHDNACSASPDPLTHLSTSQPGPKSEQDQTLSVHFGGEVRRRSPSPGPSFVSVIESENLRIGRVPDRLGSPGGDRSRRYGSGSPGVAAPGLNLWRGRVERFWRRNKGLGLVLLSQVFGTLMNVTTRLLEMEGNDGWFYHFLLLFIVYSPRLIWMCAMEYSQLISWLFREGLSSFSGMWILCAYLLLGLMLMLRLDPFCSYEYHCRGCVMLYVVQ